MQLLFSFDRGMTVEETVLNRLSFWLINAAKFHWEDPPPPPIGLLYKQNSK